jgi:hypothetical protein
MKSRLFIFGAFILMAAFSSKVSAQVSVSNTAGGEILSPITLTADVPLEFGKLAVLTGGGTVLITPASSPVVTPSGDVSLVSGTTRTAAKYTVGGAADYNYTITLPTGSVTITKSGGGATMTISDFNCLSVGTPSTPGGKLTAGTEVFYVGGTLHVGASQTAGLYSGSFNVSVNYN